MKILHGDFVKHARDQRWQHRRRVIVRLKNVAGMVCMVVGLVEFFWLVVTDLYSPLCWIGLGEVVWGFILVTLPTKLFRSESQADVPPAKRSNRNTRALP